MSEKKAPIPRPKKSPFVSRKMKMQAKIRRTSNARHARLKYAGFWDRCYVVLVLLLLHQLRPVFFCHARRERLLSRREDGRNWRPWHVPLTSSCRWWKEEN